MKKGVLFIVLFALSIVVFGQEKSNQSTIYNVKVEIKELKNRTLRCLVRNHEVILDQPKAFGADDLGPTPPEMRNILRGMYRFHNAVPGISKAACAIQYIGNCGREC